MSKVCLLSPIHTWLNPRLVKEADALHEAGYDVVVGYRANSKWGCARDDAILSQKRWRWHRFDLSRDNQPARWFAAALREKIAAQLVRRGVTAERILAEAYLRGYPEMLRWALDMKADLYIAHTQGMLAVAATAATRNDVPFAFDCEDLLAEERADGLRSPWRRDLITRLEATLLRRAAYVSVPAVAMQKYLMERYRLDNVKVWHNCFPMSETDGLLPPWERQSTDAVRVVWISGTLAPGRGLEDMLAAMPHLGERFRLCLLGNVQDENRDWLESTIAALPKPERVVCKELPAAADVMTEIARHDIGLSLDRNDCLNRSLNICNKLCIYLQAGIAVVATDTPGQATVVNGHWPVGMLYPEGNVAELVRVLLALADPHALAVAKSASWEAGRARYNWDAEKRTFLESVEAALRASGRVDRRTDAEVVVHSR